MNQTLALPSLLLLITVFACGGELEATESGGPNVAKRERKQPIGPPAPDDGKWYTARKVKDEVTSEQRERMANLEALGYASGVEEGGAEVGITRHEVGANQPGYNFYVSGHGPEAILMDERGRELHKWSCTVDQAWPAGDAIGERDFWRRARLMPDGDVLAIFENVGLVRLDKQSKVRWTHSGLAHHDLDIDEDGDIYLLERVARVVEWLHPDRPVLDDVVVVLGDDGQVKKSVSLLKCIENSPKGKRIAKLLQKRIKSGLKKEKDYLEENAEKVAADPEAYAKLDFIGDIFHTNTIQWLDGSQVEVLPAFAEGRVLLCVRNLRLVLVLDLKTEELVWSLSGPWRGQHETVLLDTGRILMFDNQGPRVRKLPRRSEVLELDPVSKEIVWSYLADGPNEFFSNIAGSCQRLDNGNTLIVESTHGRAFEVNPAGAIVWEFNSPYRAGDEQQFVAFLPDMQRVPLAEVDAWLD